MIFGNLCVSLVALLGALHITMYSYGVPITIEIY